jgi:quercetin dioxygenase-like cupin family protein
VRRTLLADLDEIAIARVEWEPGDDAVPFRCVYVLEGRLTLQLEARELQAGPGAFVHGAFAVVGGEHGHFLDLRLSGAAARGSGFARTGATAESVEVSGNRIAYLAEAHETGGALGAIEFTAPHAFDGPPLHVHRGFHDIAFVLEGTIDVLLGEKAYSAGSGTFVHAPPGVAHTFSNSRDEPLRFLNLYAPGGFERFFRQRAAATDPAELTSRYDWERA